MVTHCRRLFTMTTPKRKRGGQPGNPNSRRGAENRRQFNATADAATAWVAETMEVTNSAMLDLLADCAAALSASAYMVDDGGWYAAWTDADGETHETNDTAPTERAARILGGVERMLDAQRRVPAGTSR